MEEGAAFLARVSSAIIDSKAYVLNIFCDTYLLLYFGLMLEKYLHC